MTGFILDTVPARLYAWLRSPRVFRRAVGDVIELGGDTDTTGAIVGALAGATVGEHALPADWLRIVDYPRSLAWIRRLGEHLAARSTPTAMCWPAIVPRNLAFASIALATGLRRLLPPY